jgi:uncharacterized protein
MNPFSYGSVVSGDDFCNRTVELQDLARAMKSGERLFVYADRRMGKTSLVRKAAAALSRTGYITVYVDLWATDGEGAFTATYARAVAQALETKASKMLEAAKNFFSSLQPVLTLNSQGKPEVTFRMHVADDDHDLLEVLQAPQEIARKRKKHVVIIFDEFQRIADYANDKIERHLRSIIQHQKNVSYIFLGSRRSLIRKLFLTQERPLYRSAGHYPLSMIAPQHWIPFIEKKFRASGKRIAPEVSAELVRQTEGHPFYTQHLAHTLWDITEGGREATLELLQKALDTVLSREHYGYSNMWELLTLVQRRLLLALASPEYPGISMFSSEFVGKSGLKSASTIQRALAALADKDIIDQEGERYIILDRFLRLWLQRMGTGL